MFYNLPKKNPTSHIQKNIASVNSDQEVCLYEFNSLHVLRKTK